VTWTETPSPTESPVPTDTPSPTASPSPRTPVPFRVGVAAVPISPCGENPDWDGPITPSGVWGEEFTDTNGNNRWDVGEPFVDDPANTAIDPSSRRKYDGIFMAGFGSDRIALGCADDLWARVIVLEGGLKKVALASLDAIGYVKHGSYYGFAHAEKMVDTDLGITDFIYSSTHTHEGPDMLGLWGVEQFRDGKFPRYVQFVDRQIAKAINRAAAPENMKEASLIAGLTDPGKDPELLGMQVRTGCRPPWFFDTELRTLRFVDGEGATIATVVNWNTHPESLESENQILSSDFPHYIRQRIETELGGTAVYFSGDLGAVEIVGDTCVGKADRRSDGTNEFDRRDNIGFARTEQIGNLVAEAALRSLEGAATHSIARVDNRVTKYFLGGSNALFGFANDLGILDLDKSYFSPENCAPGAGICAAIEQQLMSLLDDDGQPIVQLMTLPGEVFPELVYGVEQHGRTDCPEANTGLPYEPAVAPAMTAPYRMFLGLSPDELGYVVPGYDFYPAPSVDEEADDVCRRQSYDPNVPGRTVPSHYHESLSIGPELAAAVTCHALTLLDKTDDVAASPACQRVMPEP